MTLDRQSFPTSDVLTKQDRVNVDLWVRIHDGDARRVRNGRTTFSLPEDTNLLVSNGFTIGFTGQSWYRKDREGYLWRVFTHKGATRWSKNLETDYLKVDKWENEEEGMSLERFKQLF